MFLDFVTLRSYLKVQADILVRFNPGCYLRLKILLTFRIKVQAGQQYPEFDHTKIFNAPIQYLTHGKSQVDTS